MARISQPSAVGLGGFTAVVGDGGPTVAENTSIAVTSGNSYTIAAAMQSLFRGAREMEVDLQTAHAVVIGATGSIGSACARILADKVAPVTLAARNATRVGKLTHARRPHVRATRGDGCDLEHRRAGGSEARCGRLRGLVAA